MVTLSDLVGYDIEKGVKGIWKSSFKQGNNLIALLHSSRCRV
jgi:hypothetical protein